MPPSGGSGGKAGKESVSYGYDYSQDYFTLGILLRLLLTGKHPFYARYSLFGLDRVAKRTNALKPVDSLSKEANDLVARLLEKDLTKRLGCVATSRLVLERERAEGRTRDKHAYLGDWREGARGIAEIKAHPWFHDVDWADVYARRVLPPWDEDLRDLIQKGLVTHPPPPSGSGSTGEVDEDGSLAHHPTHPFRPPLLTPWPWPTTQPPKFENFKQALRKAREEEEINVI